LGAEENLLKSLIAGVDVSAAKQPLLPAAAAVDHENSGGFPKSRRISKI
jgi:hypothetical protein